MKIEENPVIAVRPESVASWGALDRPLFPEPPVLDAIRGRRSARRYLPREVPDEAVERVPAAARPALPGAPVRAATRGGRPGRRYLPREVPEEAVERVLEAARWAPSPHGRQPWRFAVVTREETKARLAEAMGEEWRSNLQMDGQSVEVVEKRLEGSRRRLLDVPVLVLLCLYLEDLDAYPDAVRQQNETTMAVQSLGAAAQNALLAAYSLGLDTSWMCAPLFCPEKVAVALDLNPKLVAHALLTLGYAEADPPKRRTRRPSDELIVYRD